MGASSIYHHCKYCDGKYGGINIARHESKCMNGPMGERVFDLLRSISQNGVLPGRRDYDAARDKDMPSSNVLIDWAGGWRNMAQHVGVIRTKSSAPYQHKPTKVEMREAEVATWCDKVMRFEGRIKALDAAKANALPPLHEWRERVYQQGGKLYRELYTELR